MSRLDKLEHLLMRAAEHNFPLCHHILEPKKPVCASIEPMVDRWCSKCAIYSGKTFYRIIANISEPYTKGNS